MWGGFRKHTHDKINLNKSREPAQWTGAVFFFKLFGSPNLQPTQKPHKRHNAPRHAQTLSVDGYGKLSF